MRGASVAASGTADNLGGLVGLAAQAIDNLGEWGVGLFTLAETVLPPIPSEVVLPLAGFLAKQGDLNLVLILVTWRGWWPGLSGAVGQVARSFRWRGLSLSAAWA